MIETFKKIWRFAVSERKNLNKSVAVNILQSILKMLDMLAIYIIVTALFSGSQNKMPALIAAICMALQIISFALCQNFSQLQQTHAGYFMVADKRLRIGNKIKRIPMGFFNESSTGELTGITTSILDMVEFMAPEILVLTLSGLIKSAVFIIMILIFDWRIGLVTLSGAILYLMITSGLEKKSVKGAPARQGALTKLVEAILETVRGMSIVKSFNLTGHGDKNIRNAIDNSQKTCLALERTFTPYLIAQNVVLHISSIIMIILSVLFYLNGSMSLVNAIMVIIMSFVIYGDLQGAGSSLSEMRILASSIDQANKVDQISEIDEKGSAINTLSHSIEFNEVHFAYGSRKVLDGVSFNVADKTTTAIVGPSGSGKTTLCNLIARFWDVDSGSVKVAGHDVKDYSLESLMGKISMVFQKVYLFADTIENNIKFGCPNASHEEVVAAAKKACCHDFIENLPNGYNTMIGEGGENLSGGERQRVSIARAMLKDAPIVILDEATANVDPENEDHLQAAIEALTHGKTIIMIAHRLKTVRNADQILVLDQGRIVQKGKHEELVTQEGIYRRFVGQRSEAAGWKL